MSSQVIFAAASASICKNNSNSTCWQDDMIERPSLSPNQNGVLLTLDVRHEWKSNNKNLRQMQLAFVALVGYTQFTHTELE